MSLRTYFQNSSWINYFLNQIQYHISLCFGFGFFPHHVYNFNWYAIKHRYSYFKWLIIKYYACKTFTEIYMQLIWKLFFFKLRKFAHIKRMAHSVQVLNKDIENTTFNYLTRDPWVSTLICTTIALTDQKWFIKSINYKISRQNNTLYLVYKELQICSLPFLKVPLSFVIEKNKKKDSSSTVLM